MFLIKYNHQRCRGSDLLIAENSSDPVSVIIVKSHVIRMDGFIPVNICRWLVACLGNLPSSL